MTSVITRFPPSPTGYFHIGSARTALFNYLFAAHTKGIMYLRFEDTDRARSKKEYEDDILEGIAWLGIPYTLPTPFRQSERTELYVAAIRELIERGAAYESEEPAKDDMNKKVRVIRLKNPGQEVTFSDLIRGEVMFHTAELGDFVIARSMHDPLYHLTVVVDDKEMGVTHVIRGEDHISNTARQIMIFEALGYERPKYVHIPLILAPDRSKLSKRHGATSVTQYRRDGFIPEGVVNYLALLGWNPGHDRELYTMAELIGAFTLDGVQKSGAIFDIEKLRWFNREHLRRLPLEDFERRLRDFFELCGEAAPGYLSKALPLLRERAATLKEAAGLLRDEYSFLDVEPVPYDAALLRRGAKTDPANIRVNLMKVTELLRSLPEQASAEEIKARVFPLAESAGRAQVLWPMRVALSGKEKSPDPFTIAGLLGTSETLRRIQAALHVLPTV